MKLLGVYGSKSAIVRWLLEIGVIDEHLCGLLQSFDL